MCAFTPKISWMTTSAPRGVPPGRASQPPTRPLPGTSMSTCSPTLVASNRLSGADSSPAAIIAGLHAPQRRMPTPATPASNPRVGFVSLGCPKALVDSERILTQLKVEGYDIVQTYDDADVVVVNTCGFIDSAVAESLDAIGEAMAE